MKKIIIFVSFITFLSFNVHSLDLCSLLSNKIFELSKDLKLNYPPTILGNRYNAELKELYIDQDSLDYSYVDVEVEQDVRINSINFIDEKNSKFEINYTISTYWIDNRINSIFYNSLLNLFLNPIDWIKHDNKRGILYLCDNLENIIAILMNYII